MSEIDLHPTSPFALWANAFSPAELDQIVAYGDQLGVEEATIASTQSENVVKEKVRVTRTAWLFPTPESKWI